MANIFKNYTSASVGTGATYLVKGTPLPSGAALSVLDGKIILETTDTVIVTSSAASSCDVIVSVLEQT